MRRLTAVLVASAAVALSCTDHLTEIGPEELVGVAMSADSLGLPIGRTLRLQAFPLDESGAFRADKRTTWSSSQPGVATVSDSGVVTGVAAGTAIITAAVDGFEGRTRIDVAPAPRLGLTRDSLVFQAQAGGSDPAPDTLGVRNLGGFTLTGLTIDTIIYGAGASDWLLAVLDSGQAPATLTLTATVAGLTTASDYAATVRIAAIGADGSPQDAHVVLRVNAGPAAQGEAAEGDAQTASVNTAVPTAPAVRVTDPFDNPVSGARVVFTVTQGGGSVSGDTAVSGAAGLARVGSWTLGTSAGTNVLTGTVIDAPGAPAVTFTATGTPAAAAAMGVDGGDNQSAVAGNAVAVPPSVRVTDAFGNGVAGVTVTFAVASGGGAVTGATPATNAAGVAAVGGWTLGSSAGANTLTATVSGLTGSPVTFTATALSGAAQNLVLDGGNMQTDTVAATLPVPYTVKVTDTNGNGVAGIPVSWTVTGGGGTITMSSTTDAGGVATATRVLGTTAGTQTAQAAVGGLNGSPVGFSATALPGAAASVARSAGNNQSATVNTAVPVNPAAIVRDQFGNPVPGHAVTFAVTGGGGTVSPTAAMTTDAAGIAAVTSWTLGTVAGTNNNTLSATAAGGLTGSPLTFTASATAGAPSAIAVAAGNNQTAVSGTAVATDPAATVTDQFGNPVGGVTVTFAVTGGGGSVSGGTPTTNAAGTATLGSWTVRASGAGDANGRTTNTLSASINAGAQSVGFTGFGIYSYATHVNPKWSSGGCTGCHGGTSGLTLTGTAAQNYAALVNVNPVCDGTLVAAGYRRVATGGGTAARDLSILWTFIAPPTPLVGACDAQYMPNASGMTQGQRDTIQAWIKNGAPNN